MPQPKQITAGGLTWEVRPLDPDQQIEVECIIIRTFGPAAGAALASALQGLAPSLVRVLRDTVTKPVDPSSLRIAIEERISAIGTALAQLELLDLVEQLIVSLERAVVDIGGQHSDEMHERIQMIVEGSVTDIRTALAAGEDDRVKTVVAILAPKVIEAAQDVISDGTFDLERLGNIDTKDPRLRVGWDRALDAIADAGGEVVRDASMALASRLAYEDVKRVFDLVLLSRRLLVVQDGRKSDVTTYPVLGRLLAHDPRAKWELLGQAIRVTYSRSNPAPAIDIEPAGSSLGGGDA